MHPVFSSTSIHFRLSIFSWFSFWLDSLILQKKTLEYPSAQLLGWCRRASFPYFLKFSQSSDCFDFVGTAKSHPGASSLCRPRHLCAKCESCLKSVILVELLIPAWLHGRRKSKPLGFLNSLPAVQQWVRWGGFFFASKYCVWFSLSPHIYPELVSAYFWADADGTSFFGV